jgi:hypothetical protein
MDTCTAIQKVEIVKGGVADYEKLARYHYRNGKLSPFKAIYVLRNSQDTIGVIVYTMPSPSLELRNIATNNFFKGYSRKTSLALVNKSIRTISRVIIEPRFRSLGLAAKLVRETMPSMNVPIVEAMAVMGHVNPFFEKAGMKAYKRPMPFNCVQMKEALSLVGIEDEMLFDAVEAQRRIESLSAGAGHFLERQINRFLQCYGKRKDMQAGLERTRYVLSKLTERPVYYIWFNQKFSYLNH